MLHLSIPVFTLLCFTVHAFKDIDLDNCGSTKGCLRPAVCISTPCDYAATWRLVSQNDIDYIEFELIGNIHSSDGFISIAFSKDTYFGGDGIVGCYYDSSTPGRVAVRAAYVPETASSNVFYEETSGENLLIFEGDNLGGTYSDYSKILQCRFRRRVTPIKFTELLKDLAPPNSYHLVIQRGSEAIPSTFGNLFPGGESVSKESIIITSPLYGVSIDSQLKSQGIVKAHGCMMVLAWVFCSSVGVILARYYKEMWPNSGILGERVWFQLHRILMAVCVSLTCLSVILAFIFCQGYSSISSYPDLIHPILGLIVFILALINPFVSLCRCHPLHRNRPYYNWIHFFIGTIAHCLAIPTLMLGLRMPAAGVQLRSLNYPLWLLIFFVIFQFIVEITLEVHGCIYYRQNKNKRHVYLDEVEQYQAAIQATNALIPRPIEPEPSGRLFKYFMIGLHATVAAIVAVVLIIIIAVN